MTTRLLAGLSLLFSLLLVACGGGQADVVEDLQTTVQTEPVVEVEPPSLETPEEDIETIYYVIYWNGLHVMSVYQSPGPIRPEYTDDSMCVFDGRSDFMSVLSHYCEHETEMMPLIEQAADLDDFLRLLEDGEYEIIEYEFEEGY